MAYVTFITRLLSYGKPGLHQQSDISQENWILNSTAVRILIPAYKLNSHTMCSDVLKQAFLTLYFKKNQLYALNTL